MATLPALSVRGLIALVLVIGVGLGWLVNSRVFSRDAVAAIRHAGGTVDYDWESRDGSATRAEKPWAPDGLSISLESTTLATSPSLPPEGGN